MTPYQPPHLRLIMFDRLRRFFISPVSTPLNELYDLTLREQTEALRRNHVNPLNRSGRKIFSQTDEDGITYEILDRLGVGIDGTYAEFGVGNGLENNTLALALRGFRGFWVGGQELAFSVPNSRKFTYLKNWITRDNIVALARQGMAAISASQLDVVSLDLDGNDLYFCDELLVNGILPKLFIVEYNAKFPPPTEFTIDYDPNHRWLDDDYFGASLSLFNKLFVKHGYRLVCCNAHSGANAFFVNERYAAAFDDVPTDIARLYIEPRYHLLRRYGHRNSPRTAELILRERS